jgi:uncharacterized SAM-binding protein YcdF (DUF218 family)
MIAVGTLSLIIPGIILLRLAIAFHQAPKPQAILVLGGDPGRETAAAQLARHYPGLEVWVSGGSNLPEPTFAVFNAAGVKRDRVHLDYRATDTVTNFTTLVADFKQRDIQHLYVVTSDFHIPRAQAIATLVLGSQGIAFTPVAIPSDRPSEDPARLVRDSVRSVLWIATGKTGASLGERMNNL